MKKLFILLFFLVFSTSYGQQDTTQKIEKLTAEKIYSDVKQGFSTLVSNLQGPAKHVYHVYIKQHYAEGIMLIISWAIFSVIPLFFVLLLGLGGKDGDLSDNKGDPNTRGVIFIIVGIVSFIGLIHLVCTFSEGIQKLYNPEYYAIQDIIKAFK